MVASYTTGKGPTVTVKDSRSHIATDPLRNYRFHVVFDAPAFNGVLGFMSVSGLSQSTEVIPFRQGGYNTTTQKMPGQSDFGPITLSKGIAIGSEPFMGWVKEVFSTVQGIKQGTPGGNFRTNLDILVLAHPWSGTKVPVHAAFRVINAWPSAVAFSDLDAGANAVFIQQITLAHEGWEVAFARNASAGTKAPGI